MFQILAVLYNVLSTVIYLYSLLIVIYTLLTWVPALYNSKAGELIGKIVNPYLDMFERIIPPIANISFAPVVALLVLYFINNYVIGMIFSMLFRIFVG